MKLFPEEFALVAFPGDTFRINQYARCKPGMVRVQIKMMKGWFDFAERPAAEVWSAMVATSDGPDVGAR